jgi:hypothetical protein
MSWGTYWGVDSESQANQPPGGTTESTLLAAVKDQYGEYPAFWGRYLNVDPVLDADEAKFLFNNLVSIYVLYTAQHVADGVSGGNTDADEAIATLKSLQQAAIGGLEGCTIFADIEYANSKNSDGKYVSSSTMAAYMAAWANTIKNEGTYLPGFYMPTGSQNATPFGCAYSDAISLSGNVRDALIASPQPEPGCFGPPGPSSGTPDEFYCSGTSYGSNRLAIWQYAEGCAPDTCYGSACVDLDTIQSFNPDDIPMLW